MGSGADTFDFDNIADSGLTPATADVVEDFDRAQGDKVDLVGAEPRHHRPQPR